MNALKIIKLSEKPEAFNAFMEYLNALQLSEETINKITYFDLTHPLHHNGFHPGLALHIMCYNETFAETLNGCL